MRRKKPYKVTYSGTRSFDTFGTKREALSQAKYAVALGNRQSCVRVRLPSGSWKNVTCVSRGSRHRPWMGER